MDIDLRKTAADAAYIAVGAGVLGFQQAQVRRRDAGDRIATLAKDTQQFVTDRAGVVKERVAGTASGATDSARTIDLRQWVEPMLEQLKGFSAGIPASANTVTDQLKKVPASASTVTDQLNKVPGHVTTVTDQLKKVPASASTVTDQLNKVPGHVTTVTDQLNKVVEVGKARVQSLRGQSTN
jgi:copper chaperone CopZ